jgi:hypothetical protein
MKKFIEKFIAQESRTELDLDYPNYEGEQRNEITTPDQDLTFVEVPSIAIKEVIEILTSLQEKGSDRVYIATHEDHHGYYFYGVKLLRIKPIDDDKKICRNIYKP